MVWRLLQKNANSANSHATVPKPMSSMAKFTTLFSQFTLNDWPETVSAKRRRHEESHNLKLNFHHTFQLTTPCIF